MPSSTPSISEEFSESDQRPTRAVFCDFDGTITARETFVDVLKTFAPEKSEALIPEMYALRLTLREGVRQILESIPSAQLPAMLDRVRSAPLRPGVAEFLHFLQEQQVPFVVISGGLELFVREVLQEFEPFIAGIYAGKIDSSGEYLRVFSDFEDEQELISKVKVMAEYPAEESIAIGDSVTDLQMAQEADRVFARDRLAKYLIEREVTFEPWEDFHQIQARLKKLWETKVDSLSS
ncbi:Haloacid dehalogenase superfamily protein, subfamily IB, phosphoserine phosphatase [Planctomycetales bacterium 10988]|nr:Haloacid dehalogenase superfamily protein, subfamily IB, phosphoserine phosphatase [Planctomycetales bacterium 10988]